ncbi:ammonium transporter [Thioclava sp. BHET1]|uniref:Ammonium transporter n=1 Tax=Thioclava dalianensis TaxID=1185766 RepID=A0A074T7Z7_9RHOB|nr:ammonium transporter [Thioclava dalianensis]KEP67921.1 ammonia channel protein [Thioclava dalianensis]TMV93947.1 ammonium transporter [Thioclava sp. BHET1]SFN30325.1 ammonium transporter, Amt family [Thioclava dalianensis]
MKNFLKIAGLGAAASLLAALPASAQDATLNGADTAWMMTSSLLVLFMTMPGLALFYGGLVRSKNMLSVLMQCTMITGVVMIVWVLYGYSITFNGAGTFYGNFGKAFLKGITPDTLSGSIPEYVFIVFQMTFAVITPALIVGAFAERVKFSALVLFTILWVTFVYFPIAHMVWGGGLLSQWGAIDFAGGTVVHINAGVAGLVGAIMIGKRIGLGKENMAPHSMTLTMVGAAILWVGWFGFNAGSELAADGTAGLAMINTFVATAAALVSWAAVEGLLRGKASMLGAASGIVAGLVAVTPACGTIGPMGSLVLGLIVSPICYFFVDTIKHKFGYDDSLDAFGVHGIGGIVGALATGILTASSLGGTGLADGVTIGHQFMVQLEAVAVTIVWCGVVSAILYKIVDMIIGLRVTQEEERVGLDLSSHGESAYHTGV